MMGGWFSGVSEDEKLRGERLRVGRNSQEKKGTMAVDNDGAPGLTMRPLSLAVLRRAREARSTCRLRCKVVRAEQPSTAAWSVAAVHGKATTRCSCAVLALIGWPLDDDGHAGSSSDFQKNCCM